MRLGEWNNDLNIIRNRLTKLQIANIMESLDALQSEIEETRELLNNEEKDKIFFETNNKEIYQSVIDLEKAFLKICSLLP